MPCPAEKHENHNLDAGTGANTIDHRASSAHSSKSRSSDNRTKSASNGAGSQATKLSTASAPTSPQMSAKSGEKSAMQIMANRTYASVGEGEGPCCSNQVQDVPFGEHFHRPPNVPPLMNGGLLDDLPMPAG